MTNNTIQQLHISETKDLYLIEYDSKTNLLKYRVSLDPSELVISPVKIEGEKATVDTYFFSTYYLSKITKNEE